jgi:predicted dinucleotide-binding enzyme
MRIGILGTGVVGTTLGTGFVRSGHDVRLGSRTAGNEKAEQWAAEVGAGASTGTFAEAAEFGEVVVNATGGLVSVEALAAAGQQNLAGKVLLDVANPLDFSDGFPPRIAQPEGRSLAEQIQATFPDVRVVKTLNTMTASVMIDPRSLAGHHSVFVAGDDPDAKQVASTLLGSLGWEPDEVVDAGGIVAARGLELYLPLWLALMGSLGSPTFNIHVVRS